MDQWAIRRIGLSSLLLMENAAAGIALAVLEFLQKQRRPFRFRPVTAVCGGGNNGGDGLAAVRQLRARGVPARALLIRPASALSDDCAFQYQVLRRLERSLLRPPGPRRGERSRSKGGGIVRVAERPDPAARSWLCASSLVLDALLGTGTKPPLRPETIAWIREINAAGRPVLAVDIPSGLDADTGRPLGDPSEVVRAAATLAMGLPKTGLRKPRARPFVGKLAVVSLGIPWIP